MNNFNSPVTYDFSEFGDREKAMAREIWEAGIPNDVVGQIRIGYNNQFGMVWLEDEDLNTWAMNGSTLELWLFTPHEGNEGFISDLFAQIDETWHDEDVAYVMNYYE